MSVGVTSGVHSISGSGDAGTVQHFASGVVCVGEGLGVVCLTGTGGSVGAELVSITFGDALGEADTDVFTGEALALGEGFEASDESLYGVGGA